MLIVKGHLQMALWTYRHSLKTITDHHEEINMKLMARQLYFWAAIVNVTELSALQPGIRDEDMEAGIMPCYCELKEDNASLSAAFGLWIRNGAKRIHTVSEGMSLKNFCT